MKDVLLHAVRSVSGRGVSLAAVTFLCLTAVSPATLSAQSSPSTAKAHRKVLVKIEPEYPSILKNGHFEGQVRLAATVLPNGNVSKVNVKGGNPMLSQYAAQAVMHWKYAPGPSETLEEVVFNFSTSR